jgi:hypothetical protein
MDQEIATMLERKLARHCFAGDGYFIHSNVDNRGIEMSDEFWNKWIKADELERIKIVRSLPCFTRGGICRYMNATLMNSYLVDLYNKVKK